MKRREREGEMKKCCGGGIYRSLKERKNARRDVKGKPFFSLVQVLELLLVLHLKSLDLSAHPNEGAGWRRVMKVGWTCAALVPHAPHSWAGSAVAAPIGPMICTTAIKSERSHLCRIRSKRPSDVFCEEWNDIWQKSS